MLALGMRLGKWVGKVGSRWVRCRSVEGKGKGERDNFCNLICWMDI